MKLLTVDIETYSPQPIADVGAYRYAQDPEFEVLLISGAADDEHAQLAESPDALKSALFNPKITKRAWNASFEWWCLSEYFHLTTAQRDAWLEQWQDSMVQALYCGLPASLKDAGRALQLPEDKAKLREGAALVKYFCTPCKPTKANGGRTRNLPQHAPDKWELFRQYNRRDVDAEREIDRILAPFTVPAALWAQWRDDVRMNSHGIGVDLPLAQGAIWCQEQHNAKLTARARELTGLANPNSPKQLSDWLLRHGCEMPNLQKANVTAKLDDPKLPSDVREVLQLRQGLGKTSTTKYSVLTAAAGPDERIRGCLQFYGAARTGRWAGRLLQVQNLPRTYLDHQSGIRELIKAKDLTLLEILYDDIPDVLSQMIRTALVPAEGKLFIDADFSAIEARLLAWEAGEDWVLDVFRSTGKIYETTAARMFGIPVETIAKGNPNYSYRQRGKVATLALGYNGGVGAMRRMDTSGALAAMDDDAIQDMVNRWRQSNPNIVALWRQLDAAAKKAILTGRAQPVKPKVHDPARARDNEARTGANEGAYSDFFNGNRTLCTFRLESSTTAPFAFLTLQLPSGRKLYYAQPRVEATDGRIYYMEQTVSGWGESETYGGKLAENLTQAIGRDCLEYALRQLKTAGYNVVFHVHDEVVIEADAAQAAEQLDDVRRIMSQPAPWAAGLPLNAEGWVGAFFTKD